MHNHFDRLRIWFTHVEASGNTYRIESTDGAYLFPVAQNPVTFTSTDPALPLPDPEYLKLHRACARVVQRSGAIGM
ncbi:hypothetical protein PENSPDRAFT_595993 [Peniophora sp. CONT]|nr:hypothetical protein PENSPDRAFT_595993 [Peniophora sp. CONT]